MKRLLCGALLLAAGSLMAQQQDSPPYNSPDNAPPKLPQEQAPALPDVPAPSPEANQNIQQQIQKDLSTEPVLADSVVDVTVYDNSIVLMGTVGNEQQHVMALRIAASHAGDRVIVDAIQAQEKEGYRL
ncbi:MAG: BON domain-containing protein [Candidatus Korobacteraceae bacterium]|jgi:hypothetical protein